MTTTATSLELGPVSAALEADVRRLIGAQGVVVWLDNDDRYGAFVDRLVRARAEGLLPYEVHAYRGSYLELLLALEDVAAGGEKPMLLLHLPGFTEDRVRASPMLELYKAGTRYRKALPSLISDAAAGAVLPTQIAAFTSQGGLTLDLADAWLASMLRDSSGGLSAQLRAMTSSIVVDDLLADGFVASRVNNPSDAEAIWGVLAAWTGLPSAWREATLPGAKARAWDFAFAVSSWALAVEYVHDLKRPTRSPLLAGARELPTGVVKNCHELAAHLRIRHPDTYRRTADETEALLAEEVDVARAEDLGAVDTFRFEEELVLEAALVALEHGDWGAASTWAKRRTEATDTSFWLGEDPHRRSAWQLVAAAAHLGATIATAGALGDVHDLSEALVAYVDRGAAVDQAHRHLEQRRLALLYPQLPEFDTLRSRLTSMRQAWRDWAEAWARDFNALCTAHGFLPSAGEQQRNVFEDIVMPMTQESGMTAVFVIDALRYEMAAELHRSLEGTPATTSHLRARYAELPTVTEVGMNVLAPVAVRGRLTPALTSEGDRVSGFTTGEYRVFDPDTRKRAMHERAGGATCPWLSLDDVISRDATSLKRAVAQARLVVVHARDIDDAGERGVGTNVFDTVLQRIRAAWNLLRDAGVRRFVMTADHGFLLLHDQVATSQPHGRRSDPNRRHVLTHVAADAPDTVRVAFSDLGYDGTNAFVLFPKGVTVFDTGRPTLHFVHGGNSLQERVIPVLTLVHRTAAGGSGVAYAITAEARDSVAGMQCIEISTNTGDQGALDFGTQRTLELALRAMDATDIQVELAQTRGPATLSGGMIEATVGTRFEVFFRLVGPTDRRVRLEVFHPSAMADVTPATTEGRFTVIATRSATLTTTSADAGWLDAVKDEGVRRVFDHIARFGAITEAEATPMLGGPRGARRFAMKFEEHAAVAPFAIRIDVVGGTKRYVRDGSNA